jgi:hypothetical protein
MMAGTKVDCDRYLTRSKQEIQAHFAFPDQAYRRAARVSAAPGCKDRGNQPTQVRHVLSGSQEELP